LLFYDVIDLKQTLTLEEFHTTSLIYLDLVRKAKWANFGTTIEQKGTSFAAEWMDGS